LVYLLWDYYLFKCRIYSKYFTARNRAKKKTAGINPAVPAYWPAGFRSRFPVILLIILIKRIIVLIS